eukprot:PhF_6_TR7059/c0_g1_i5/m.10654
MSTGPQWTYIREHSIPPPTSALNLIRLERHHHQQPPSHFKQGSRKQQQISAAQLLLMPPPMDVVGTAEWMRVEAIGDGEIRDTSDTTMPPPLHLGGPIIVVKPNAFINGEEKPNLMTQVVKTNRNHEHVSTKQTAAQGTQQEMESTYQCIKKHFIHKCIASVLQNAVAGVVEGKKEEEKGDQQTILPTANTVLSLLLQNGEEESRSILRALSKELVSENVIAASIPTPAATAATKEMQQAVVRARRRHDATRIVCEAITEWFVVSTCQIVLEPDWLLRYQTAATKRRRTSQEQVVRVAHGGGIVIPQEHSNQNAELNANQISQHRQT